MNIPSEHLPAIQSALIKEYHAQTEKARSLLDALESVYHPMREEEKEEARRKISIHQHAADVSLAAINAIQS